MQEERGDGTPGERIGELTDIVCDAFRNVDELALLIREVLGADLYNEVWTERLPLRQSAFRMLDGLEARGLTAVVLQAVLRARPARADLRADIERLCPEALLSDTRSRVSSVITGVQNVAGHLADPVIRGLVSDSRTDIERVTREINLLARYKALHDCLHRIQLRSFREMERIARRVSAEPDAYEAMISYLTDLQIRAKEGRRAVEGLPDTPVERGQELAWLATLDEVIGRLETALNEPNQRSMRDAAHEAAHVLKGLIRLDLVRINRTLSLIAESLPLYRVVELLGKTISLVEPVEPLVHRLRDAQTSLQALLLDLRRHVEEHSHWQRVDKDMWQAEDALRNRSLEEFELIWLRINRYVKVLREGDPAAPWVEQLKLPAERIDSVFSGTLPAVLSDELLSGTRDQFNRYRHWAMLQFYNVDFSLKDKCDEITALGQPLKELLAEVPDVR